MRARSQLRHLPEPVAAARAPLTLLARAKVAPENWP